MFLGPVLLLLLHFTLFISAFPVESEIEDATVSSVDQVIDITLESRHQIQPFEMVDIHTIISCREFIEETECSRSETLSQAGKVCIICQDTLIDPIPQFFNCSHTEYHPKCLKTWIIKCDASDRSRTCPICRAIADDEQLSLELKTPSKEVIQRREKRKEILKRLVIPILTIVFCGAVIEMLVLGSLGYFRQPRSL